MTLLTKALQLAGQLTKKAPSVDPAAVIRSALGAAGLLGPNGSAPSGASDPMGCLAPTGLSNNLEKLLSGLRPGGLARTAEPAQPAHGAFAWHTAGREGAGRRYKLFVPELAGAPKGLIVMLHGCSQNPDDFAAGTRMNAVAAEYGLLVAYPEQTRSANPSGCWNWFNPADQSRGAGEPASIAGIVQEIEATFGVPAGRCFVAGLSAGGAMAAVMAETYPELFAAAGIHSGLPYRAATDMGSAFAAMQGHVLKAAHSLEAGIPLIVFHGDADRTVAPSNTDAIVARLAASEPGLALDKTRNRSPGGQTYSRTVARDGKGAARFEDWRLAGAGHAWSGGSPAGSYTDPAGPDASREMVRFFLEQGGPVAQDAPAPLVALS